MFIHLLVTLNNLWDIKSLTRDRTQAHGSESTESQPLDHQRIPQTSHILNVQKSHAAAIQDITGVGATVTQDPSMAEREKGRTVENNNGKKIVEQVLFCRDFSSIISSSPWSIPGR